MINTKQGYLVIYADQIRDFDYIHEGCGGIFKYLDDNSITIGFFPHCCNKCGDEANISNRLGPAIAG